MDIDPYLQKFSEALRPLVKEIYERGYRDGKSVGEQEAAARLRARLSSVLGEEGNEYTGVYEKVTKPDNDRQKQDEGQRASPGTVKPAILDAIRKSNAYGITTREIASQTGFKYNSVRGTVWALHKDDLIKKSDKGRWVAADPAQQELVDAIFSHPTNEPPNG